MSYTTQQKPTKNRSRRGFFGFGTQPKGITCHHWGQDGQRHSSVVSWLQGVGNPNTSAHEVISAGLVSVLAPGTVATWHAGNKTGNGKTIGLEFRPEMSAGDWQTIVERCADLELRYGSMRYYRHSDWKATACPGRYSSRIAELVNAVNQELARRKKPVSKPAKPKPGKAQKKQKRSIQSMANEVIAGKHGNGHTARQHSLAVNGATYAKVRQAVNKAAGVTSPRLSIMNLQRYANEAIAGKHGNGHAKRRRSMGVNSADYAKIRKLINQRL